ncbi:iron-containing alcohol dehydrogenase-domain containing protein, partial [Ochromonadaceae sp. CCMP2298]
TAAALKQLKITRPLIVTGSGGLSRHQDLFREVFPSDGGFENTGDGGFENTGGGFPYSAFAVSVSGEPTVEDAVRISKFAIERGCDGVLAVGGGSALDVGKAASALIPNSHRDVYDFLEVVGKGMGLDYDPLGLIAVPTTSGTGSEATKNAVLKSVAHGLKVSIRHDKMFPAVAVLDPLLTVSCPPR